MKSRLMRERYLERMTEQARLLTEALKEADTVHFRCNPKHKVEGGNYLQPNKRVKPKPRRYTSGNIVAGAGYSGDSQQFVSQICYNATVSSTSAQQGFVQLETALSFSELEDKLGISVSVGGRYGFFSVEAKASYMRSLQDKDYSMSLNYYEYNTNNVAVQIAGYGEQALTESGKGFYKDGANPLFGLLCGDHYISSYQQGTLLAMAMNIQFSSSNAKQEFLEKVGASFGAIINAAQSVKAIVTKYKTTGSVTIQAFQMGGDPEQLAKLLNKDSTGDYYALECSLAMMDNCIKAASGLLDYAQNNFSTQFSFKNNTGLTPLGTAFTQYNPIEYIGLNSSVSLVTPEVKRYRHELSSRLKESEYYQQKFYPFFNKGYPVELDTDFVKKANTVLSKANHNVGILMQAHEGAIDCFNFPDNCKNIKAHIDSQLENISVSSLEFLEAIKYTVTTVGGMFYSTGSGTGTSWSAVPDDKPDKEILAKVKKVVITDTVYAYDTDVHIPNTSELYECIYNGNSSKSSNRYEGTICKRREGTTDCNPPAQNFSYLEHKLVSPFFFEVFNSSEWV